MKALSLWQPWATLVAVGAKRFETRHWSTRYRGPIAIHAAKRQSFDFEQELLDEIICLFGRHDLPAARDLPRGAVVAVTELIACHRIGSDFAAAQSDLERSVGDWTPGRFAWELAEVEALVEPLPYTGRQGLFDIPDDLIAALL